MAGWDKRPIIYCLSLSLCNDSCRVSEVDSVAESQSLLVPTPSIKPFTRSFSEQCTFVKLYSDVGFLNLSCLQSLCILKVHLHSFSIVNEMHMSTF